MSASPFFPERPPLPDAVTTHALIRESIRVADAAMAKGKHPFGCVLVGPDSGVLMEQGIIDTVNHAEITMAREATAKYKSEFLWECTLVTNFEPCCMCAGAIYWASESGVCTGSDSSLTTTDESCFLVFLADIGRVIYGAPESALLSLTGSNSENPTLALPCRTVFAAGPKDVQVIGPVPEMQDAVLSSHRRFWQIVGRDMHAT